MCPCSWYVIQFHDRVVHVFEEFMLEAGASKGRDLRLEVRRIRSGASRDRPMYVVWLEFMAPRRHLVVDVKVTSARTNANVPHISARLPFPYNLALGAQHRKLDADLRTSALLGTPSVQSVHDHYLFAVQVGGRLALMAADLSDRLALLVAARCFPGGGVADSRSLRSDTSCPHATFRSSIYFVPIRRSWGVVRREIMQRLSVALHGTLGSNLRDAFEEGNANTVAYLHIPRA
jgi:hypothetical protein